MLLNIADTNVQVALINGLSSISSAAIAAVCAALIGKRFLNQKKLKQNLAEACGDIEFLLQVEAAHCEEHILSGDESNKKRMRDLAKEMGYVWTGKFTPGRAKANGHFDKPE